MYIKTLYKIIIDIIENTIRFNKFLLISLNIVTSNKKNNVHENRQNNRKLFSLAHNI